MFEERKCPIMKLEDIARIANVSRVTVSRAINGHPCVKPETRERILGIIERNNYAPNRGGRGLVRRSAMKSTVRHVGWTSWTGGVPVVSGMSGTTLATLQGVESFLRKRNCRLLVNTIPPDIMASEIPDFLADNRVEGLLLQGCMPQGFLELLAERRIPYVAVNTPFVECYGGTWVGTAEFDGVSVAMHHLFSLGHSKIAFFGGPQATLITQRRQRAYLGALARAGIAPRKDYYEYYGDWTDVERGSRLMDELLKVPDRPTALIASTDWLAFGAIRHCLVRGIRVPGELSVIGYDDVTNARHIVPALTTLRWDPVQLGEVAASELLQSIENPGLPCRRIIMSTKLIIRDSTSRIGEEVPVDDPAVPLLVQVMTEKG
jgi:DNA-binding LacI/PurR family transcriptional regulator